MLSNSPWTSVPWPPRSPKENIVALKISQLVTHFHPHCNHAHTIPTIRMTFVSSPPTQSRSTLLGVSTTPKPKESRLGVWTALQRPPRQSSSTKLIGISRSTVTITLPTPRRRGRTLLNRKPRTVAPNQYYQIAIPLTYLVGGRLEQPPPFLLL